MSLVGTPSRSAARGWSVVIVVSFVTSFVVLSPVRLPSCLPPPSCAPPAAAVRAVIAVGVRACRPPQPPTTPHLRMRRCQSLKRARVPPRMAPP